MTQPTSKRLLTEANAAATYPTAASVAATYAPLAARLKGSSRVAQMPGSAPMASPPTITWEASQSLWNSTVGSSVTPNTWPYPRTLQSSGSPRYLDQYSVRYPKDRTRSDGSGTISPFVGCARERFDFDGTAFEFRTQIQDPGDLRVWVNEQLVSTTLWTSFAAAGTNGWVKIDFGSRGYRRIELEMTGGAAFLGIVTGDSSDGMFPPTVRGPRFLWIGDSYGYGVGGDSYSDACSIQTGKLLGFSDIWNFTSVSSTGVVQAASATDGPYHTRFAADVIPNAPDLIVYQGSINDTNTWPGNQSLIAPQVVSDIATLRAALPKTAIVITSPLFVATPMPNHLLARDALQSGAASAGVPFIDMLDPDARYFYGTGYVGSPHGDGNADAYRAADGTHPTKAGHLAIARALAPRIASALSIHSGG